MFRAWQDYLFWVWLCEKTTPLSQSLNTPFSFTRRDVLRPTHGPWALQLAKSLVSSRCLFLSSQLRWGFGSQSRSTHGFNCAANPLVQRTFMTTRPMFALWVVQPLPTSPGDPYLISRCNQNEIRWPLSSTCTDIECGELLRFKGCLKNLSLGFIAKMFECISSE